MWSTEIDRAIDSCRVMIAVMTPGSYASGICHGEQLVPLDRGNRVIPVLAVRGSDRPLYLYTLQFRDFTDQAQLRHQSRRAPGRHLGDATATLPKELPEKRVSHTSRSTAGGQLPERRGALDALRNACLRKTAASPLPRPQLNGMGGIGKDSPGQGAHDDPSYSGRFPTASSGSPQARRSKRDRAGYARGGQGLGDDLSGYDNDVACENVRLLREAASPGSAAGSDAVERIAEESGLLLRIVRDLRRVHSHLASVAYPILNGRAAVAAAAAPMQDAW